jgi:hypothetical protein
MNSKIRYLKVGYFIKIENEDFQDLSKAQYNTLMPLAIVKI